MLEKIFHIFFVLLILGISNAKGQVQYVDFETFNVDNGLISNETQVILQDYMGFMWFGTKSGLVRYDGYDPVPYQANPNDSSQLQINGIEVLYEGLDSTLWIICGFPGQNFYLQSYNREKETFDIVYGPFRQSWRQELTPPIIGETDGTIWLRTSSGLIKVSPTYPKHKKLRKYSYKRYSNQPLSDSIYSLFMDTSQKLWIGSASGLSYYDRELDTILHVQNPSIHGIITGINQVNSGELVLATYASGLFVWNPSTNELKNHNQTSKVNSGISGGRVIKMVKDKRGNIWMRTYDSESKQHGLDRFDPVEQVFTNYDFSSDHQGKVKGNVQPLLGRETLFTDRQGEIWVFSWAGIERYNPDKDSFYQLKYISTNRQITWGNFATFYEDRSGKYWISYVLGGMLTYAPSTKKIHAFHYIPGDSYSVSHGTVISLYEDLNENIWVGSYGGIDKFTLDERHQVLDIKHFRHNPDEIYSVSQAPFYVFMHSYKDSLIWIKAGPKFLNQLDLTTERFYHKQNSSHPLLKTEDPVAGMIEANDGRIWYGTLGAGLKVFEPTKNQTRTFLPNPNDSQSISSAFIIPFFLDKQEQLWCVSGKGLVAFDTRLETAKIFMEDVSFGRLRGLVQEDKGLIWIPTGGGLYKYNIKKNTYRIFSLNDSFPTFSVNSILEDHHRNLWLSSDRGIIHFNPETEKVQSYGLADGLPTLQFAFGRTMKRKNGDLMFGTAGKGFVIFHPDSLHPNPHAPQIVITDFLLGNQPIEPSSENGILEKDISLTDYIELAHHQNTIGFQYAALHYAKSDQNQYAYMMEGIDKDWLDVKTRRFAGYSGLSPGLYTFKVRGTNADGILNKEGVSIKIRIRYPWWQRWWAWGIYSIIFLGLLVLARQELIRQERLKADVKLQTLEKEKLQEVDRLKTQFFANISHEFRTPLTLIIGPIQRMLSDTFQGNVKEQYKIILRNGQRLLQLINQLLDLSKLEADEMKLKAAREDFIPFLKTLIAAFESRAESRNMQLSFEADTEELWLYFDRDKMEKILINLLSNAFKFTPDYGKIELNVKSKTVEKESSFITLTLTDTGIGIKEERLPHIFNRFYQVDDSQTRTQEGTGIGLALVEEFVQLHHGHISVKSKWGQGTTFQLKFPMGKAHLKVEEIVARSGYKPIEIVGLGEEREEIIPAKNGISENPVLLIVEDNPDMRAYLRENLAHNFKILQASNGRKGLEIALEEVPDLVISDIMMPEMDGQELCHRLKTDERTSHIPVVLLTAKAGEEAKISGLQTGADDYMTKPFSPTELRVRTQNLIEQRELLRQRFSQNIYLKPKELVINSSDEKFLQKAMSLIENNMSDFDFGVEVFVKELVLSRQQVYRKLKALVNQSPSVFIRTIRLKRVAQLLEQPHMAVAEAMYQAGFSNHAYFSQQFKAQFGMTPSEYKEQKQSGK